MDIEEIQQICKSLPSVTEDIKWVNDLAFSIGGKMFCVVTLNEVPVSACFKVTEDQFEELCEMDGFKPAPYVGKYKWVMIDNINRINKKQWLQYITQSYSLIKSKLPPKVLKLLRTTTQ